MVASLDSVTTTSIARLAAMLRLEDLPGEVVEQAKLCIRDWFGVAIAGSREPLARPIHSLIPPSGGPATVVGTERRADALLAALANGAQSHALDFDETHQSTHLHVSAPVLPALLAAAETRGRSGAAVLAAYVAGVEAEGRVARRGGRRLARRGFHVTGVLGHLGAAAAVANLLGLDPGRTEHALGVAATQAAGLETSFGTMCKPLHPGKAAMDGLLAALLAEQGFTGPGDVVEGPDGLLATLLGGAGDEPDVADTGRWIVQEVSFKAYPSCSLTHATIDAAREIHERWAPSLEEIERVECHVFPLAVKVAAKPAPTTGLEGKFSVQYCVALALATGDAREADFDDASVQRPELQACLARVQPRADASLSPSQARTRVVLRDGQVLEQAIQAPRGDPLNPMSDAELKAKFLGLAAPIVSQEQAERLADLCARLERLPDLRELLAAASLGVRG